MSLTAKIPSRYEVLSELGSGGMGTVFKVRDKNLDTVFALKLLKFTSIRKEQAVRFQKEAKSAGALKHENIVSVVDFGFSEELVPYMVLEYVEGQTLKDLLKAGPLPFEQAIPIFDQIARALAYAHDKGVVHRDLKPSNILITTNEHNRLMAKIFDFGIAKMSTPDKASTLTPRNAIIGSPGYMSPEQSSGDRSDGRSDIYSFGCVMFETLTGELPFLGSTPLELIKMHATEPAPQLSEVLPYTSPRGLNELVDTCLRKKKEDRHASAHVLREKLQALDTALNTAVEPVQAGAPGIANHDAGRRDLFVLAASVAFCCVCLLSFWCYERFAAENSRKTELKLKVQQKAQPEEKTVNQDYSESYFLQRRSSAGDSYRLDLYHDFDFQESGLSQIPKWPISELTIPSHLKLTAANLRTIASMKLLDLLELRGATINGSTIGELKKLPKLRILDISEASVDEQACKEIGEFPKLRKVIAADTRFSSADAIRAFGRPKFNWLDLSDTSIDDKGLEAVCTLPTLKGLDLGNFNRTMTSITPLSTMPMLETLYLKGVALSKANLEVLSRATKIESLSCERCDPVDAKALKALCTLKKLWHLDIKNCPSISKQMPDVVESVKLLPNLVDLGLEGDYLSDKEIIQLAPLKQLKVLSISRNLLTDKGLLTLAEKLPSLDKLSISGACSRNTIDLIKKMHPNCTLDISKRVDLRQEPEFENSVNQWIR
ncbi:MAG: protein kinase [Cyanobacteria bacterium]|nr:protein kinase [Cyanobacteriota bacterium]